MDRRKGMGRRSRAWLVTMVWIEVNLVWLVALAWLGQIWCGQSRWLGTAGAGANRRGKSHWFGADGSGVSRPGTSQRNGLGRHVLRWVVSWDWDVLVRLVTMGRVSFVGFRLGPSLWDGAIRYGSSQRFGTERQVVVRHGSGRRNGEGGCGTRCDGVGCRGGMEWNVASRCVKEQIVAIGPGSSQWIGMTWPVSMGGRVVARLAGERPVV